MNATKQLEDEIDGLTLSLKKSFEQADFEAHDEQDDGIRWSHNTEHCLRRENYLESAKHLRRVFTALTNVPGQECAQCDLKTKSKFLDALKASALLLDNAQKRVNDALSMERRASTEEEWHVATCSSHRAEREYDDVLQLHLLILKLI